MTMFDVNNIIGSCIGKDDSQNAIPHSYIFLLSCNKWPSYFNLHMIDLMEQEGEIVHEDCSDKILTKMKMKMMMWKKKKMTNMKMSIKSN